MYHASVWILSCPGTATLKELLDQELNKHEDDRNLITVSGTLRVENTKRIQGEEHKEILIDAIDDLTRPSTIAKLKITSS